MEATDIAEARRTAVTPTAPERRRRDAALAAAWRALPYVAIAVIPALVLAPWLGAPIEKDEGAYITIGMGIRHGLIPYKDLFDNKTPLIYVVYFFSYILGGGIYTPRLLAAASLGATAICVASIGREFRWMRWQYLAGGFVFAVSTSNVLLEANANTEAFMVLPLTASLLTMLIARREETSRRARIWWCALSGVLAAAAILFKTAAAPPVGVIFLYLCVQERDRRSLPIAYAAGAAAPLVLCVLVFAALGALPAFIYANYTFNRMFFGGIPLLSDPSQLWSMPTRVLAGGFVFWVAAAFGAVAAAVRFGRNERLLLLWAAAGVLGVKATGLEHSHYYVEMLPMAALLTVVALRAIPRIRPVRLLVVGLTTVLVVFQSAFYVSLAKPGDDHASYTGIIHCEKESPALARWARAHSNSGDTIYNLGRDTEMYYYAGRLPAARFMYDRVFPVDPATSVPQTVRQLQRSRPAVIVDTFKNCTQPGVSVPPQIAAFVAQNYTLVTTIGDAKMYELNTRRPSTTAR